MHGFLRPQKRELHLVTLDPVEPAHIPPRPWAYGHYLMLGQVGVLGAVDGAGKTAVAVIIALAMITGRALLGERIWRTGPVVIVKYEEDDTEWQRRIAAACLHYGIDYAAVIEQVHFARIDGDGRISFGGIGELGEFYSDANQVIASVHEISAALLIVDPYNHCHDLEDGNNNVMMARVAGELVRVARETKAAVLLLHHLRKGSLGSIDDLMGATSLRATVRSCRILARLDAQTAAEMDIKDPWRYVRITSSKENYAPPPEHSIWYRLIGEPLQNGTPEYPDGDVVSVATKWSPSPPFEGIDGPTLRAVFARLRETPHGASRRSTRLPWAGAPLMEIGYRSEREAGRILAAWQANRVALVIDHQIRETRKTVQAIALDESKVSAILAELGPGLQ